VTLRAKLSGSKSWAEQLPVVLLGLRAAFKEGLGCSSAHLVYGTALRLPGLWAGPAEPEMDPLLYLQRLQRTVNKFMFSETAWNCKQNSSELKGLQEATAVYVLVPKMARGPLDAVYAGPYKVVEREDKAFKVSVEGREKWITVDRLKPAVTEQQILGSEESGAQVIGRSRRGRPIKPPQRLDL
jgi:hypothetical protein